MKSFCFSIPGSGCNKPALPSLGFLCLLQTTASESGLLKSSSDPSGLGMASPLVCKHSPLSPAAYNPEDIGQAMARLQQREGHSSEADGQRHCFSLAWQRPRGEWTAWSRAWSTHPSMRRTARWIATARSPATAGTGGTGERPPRQRGGQHGAASLTAPAAPSRPGPSTGPAAPHRPLPRRRRKRKALIGGAGESGAWS